MMGGATAKERESLLRVIEDLQERVQANHLGRETVVAIDAAIRDFGKRYLENKPLRDATF